MKICLIIDDYLPDSIKIGAKMMHELACRLKKEGHEVTVVTPAPGSKRKKSVDTLDGITIYRFKSGRIKNVNKVERAINETLLSRRAWQAFKEEFTREPHDLIVYYSPTIFWSPLVERLKKLWHAPSYLILRDIFPQWAVDQGLIREGSLVEKYFRHFEKRNYAAADTIGLMSKKNLEWFRKEMKAKAATEILYNWAENSPVDATGLYRKRLGLEKRVIYFYGGNIGHAQDMMNIVRLAKKMQKYTEAHFLLVGAGDEVEKVQNAIVEQNLTNMTLLPPVSQEEFKRLLAECDIGLFTLHKNHTTHNFPGKLLGYMVQSMPILGSINAGNDLKEIIESAGAGYVTINGEDERFFENAVKLLDEERRERMGKNALRLLHDTFSVEAAAAKIVGRAAGRNAGDENMVT
ncbi:glycosyltransferase family 4 protein [Hydrogenimonas cancrithermarum]|uniref:Glycosyltransferase WbuB n=1 Tax=Hydrogenimonas cancrithermarum TaxID=2993563 RepID=A0ABM8FMB9_9BACT|nr:glycosyltransferase family 4 protein [Hydrogenimonas cancrithermarum]BDY13530.1 glycosyltransferase WbuB [Hydrogenimonas cancrithermarum]